MLESGAKVTLTNSVTGSTALHEAAAFGNREIVEHLLKNEKADANASDYKAVTPLMHASGSGYSIICEYLLQHGAHVDSCSAEGMTALHFASTNGDRHVTQQIVEAGEMNLLILFYLFYIFYFREAGIIRFVLFCFSFLSFLGSDTYGISALVTQTSFARAQVATSRNVGCFLRLPQ